MRGARFETAAPEELAARVAALKHAGARFATIVGDEVEGVVHLTYAFVDHRARELALMRVPASDLKVPSIVPHVPAANWAEREVRELFGVAFEGSPDTRPLVLHEDWPQEPPLRPLRRDFTAKEPPKRAPQPFDYVRVEGEGVMEIPVGPIHAGIIEPGHFRFSCIGETVLHLEGRLFYVHRGLEQRARGLEPAQAIVLAERTSGFGSFAHALACAHAFESALELEVAPEVRRLRTLVLELERLWNHVFDVTFLCAGTSLAVLGAEGLIMRERLLRTNEAVFGSRFLRGIVAVGGVRRVPDVAKLKEGLAEVDRVLDDFAAFLPKFFGSASNLERLTGTGILRLEHARALGCVGVGARASGAATDSRADLPDLSGLAKDPFHVVSRHEGDVAARAHQRVDEVKIARERIRACVEEGLPQAASAKPFAADGAGEGFGWAEGARGEALHYVRLERGVVARLKVRSPSRMNWAAVPLAVPGNIVPDFPLINKSFNLSYAGCDL